MGANLLRSFVVLLLLFAFSTFVARSSRAAVVVGTKRIAVVPIHATQHPPVSVAALSAQIAGEGRTVDTFFEEASTGQLTIEWTFAPWYRASFSGSEGTCDDAFHQREAAIAASGIDEADYDALLFFLWPLGCPSHGGGGRAYINGLGLAEDAPGYPTQIHVGTVAHELGHGLLGLPDTPANDYDLMGDGEARTPRHLSLPHQLLVGWMPAANVQTVTAPGFYTFRHSEQRFPGAIQGLQIPTPGGVLLLDYRRPFGTYFDDFPAGHWATEGVAIFRKPSHPSFPLAIVDATPETSEDVDKTLRPGRHYYDAAADLTITAIAVDEENATIRLTSGAPPAQATAEVSGSILYVTAVQEVARDIRAEIQGGDYLVRDLAGGSIAAGAGCSPVGGSPGSVRCPAGSVSRLVVTTGPAADRIEFTGDRNVGVFAGAGDDEIVGGDGDDVLNGGDGTDVVDGGPGDDAVSAGSGHGALDVLHGGPGANRLFGSPSHDRFFSGPDGDVIAGGLGEDTVDYRDRSAPVTVTIGSGAGDDGEAGEGDTVQADVEHLVGTEFGDLLVGTDGPNSFFALGGDDTLIGHGGDDSLYGMIGSDELVGCAGDDLLVGDAGRDVLVDALAGTCAGGGIDTLQGGTGDDHLDPGAGNDVVEGGAGEDMLSYASLAEPGMVRVTLKDARTRGGPTPEKDEIVDVEGVTGGPGGDTLRSLRSVRATLFGGPGDDKLYGPKAGAYLDGGQGDDRLTARGGTNTLAGGPGDDRISGRRGVAWILGGPGDDSISSVNGAVDVVLCEDGEDRASIDTIDVVPSGDCERLRPR